MTEPTQAETALCWLNGAELPFAEARLPVFDLSIMQGATITERMRTFRHQPFDVEQHLKRFQRSLHVTGWSQLPDLTALPEVITRMVAHNCRTIPAESDLAIVLFCSAGQAVGDANGLITQSRPTICIYTAPLPFSRWSRGYQYGIDLVVPPIQQIPATCLDPHLKHRSRLHWQLADQFAERQHSGAQAVLLDQQGYLTETSTGNLLLANQGTLLTPRNKLTLEGISREHVIKLCHDLEIPVGFTDLTELDLATADEAFLTSSTYCIMPIRSINGQPIGSTVPGPLTTTLSHAWSQQIGVDFITQAHTVTSALT